MNEVFQARPTRTPLGVDPELAGGLHISSGLETPQDPPGGAGTSGIPCLICCHCEPTPDKRDKMDGWRNVEQAMFFCFVLQVICYSADIKVQNMSTDKHRFYYKVHLCIC